MKKPINFSLDRKVTKQLKRVFEQTLFPQTRFVRLIAIFSFAWCFVPQIIPASAASPSQEQYLTMTLGAAKADITAEAIAVQNQYKETGGIGIRNTKADQNSMLRALEVATIVADKHAFDDVRSMPTSQYPHVRNVQLDYNGYAFSFVVDLSNKPINKKMLIDYALWSIDFSSNLGHFFFADESALLGFKLQTHIPNSSGDYASSTMNMGEWIFLNFDVYGENDMLSAAAKNGLKLYEANSSTWKGLKSRMRYDILYGIG